MIFLAITLVWTASLVPAFLIGVGYGRDDERARTQDRLRVVRKCAALRTDQ